MINIMSLMKPYIYLFFAFFLAGCATRKTTSGAEEKPTSPAAVAVAVKSKFSSKESTTTELKTSSPVAAKIGSTGKAQTAPKTSPLKKTEPPVVTKEETTSIQKIVDTVPLAAPDVDFKKP